MIYAFCIPTLACLFIFVILTPFGWELLASYLNHLLAEKQKWDYVAFIG